MSKYDYETRAGFAVIGVVSLCVSIGVFFGIGYAFLALSFFAGVGFLALLFDRR